MPCVKHKGPVCIYTIFVYRSFLLDLQGLFSCLATESQLSAGVCPLVHAV